MFRFLFIIVLFGAALASGTWGMRAYREHLAETEAQESTDAVEEPKIEFETFSVANLLKEQPAEDSAVELVDFYFPHEVIGVDLDGEPGWEEVYLPIFPDDISLKKSNLISVIYKTQAIKSPEDVEAFFEQKTLKAFYVANDQQLSKVAFGKLAKRYGSLDYTKCVLITENVVEEKAIEKHWFALAAFAGFLSMAGWQSLGLIGHIIRRRKNRDDSIPTDAAGLAALFNEAQQNNTPEKYKRT